MQVDAVLGYLQQITHYDRSAFAPLQIGAHTLGAINPAWQQRLLVDADGLFQARAGVIHCLAEGGYPAISQALMSAARRWRDAGWLTGWRDENFTAFLPDGTPFFELERAAFRPLGLTSRAVHLNGLTRLPNGDVAMWIGRRSPHKAVDPNRMDNMMGGGIAAGESIPLALQREGWEEAGIAAQRLQGLSAASLLLAERPVQRGLHREWLYVFDLWLTEGEQPSNQDGEVAEHVCLPLAEVEQLIVDERFMIDAALVAVDCMARLGYWQAHTPRINAALAATRHDPQLAIPQQSACWANA